MKESNDHDEIADCDFYTVYELDGIQYLPHYKEPTYVSPGYGRSHWTTYTGDELKAAGGKAGIGYLLLRSKHKTLQ